MSAICPRSSRELAAKFVFRFVCGLLALAWTVNAAPKDGVGLSKISLPSGPGSIEGLGDAFEPQLNSGTAAYSIKIAAPPGVNGLQPGVVLRYNGGSGNGHFGLGWDDGLMCLQRQTEKGFPRYSSQDVFKFQGEELVALDDGTYRQKNESSFMRFRRSGDGWEITDKSGTRYLLGSTTASRLARPGGNTFNDTFKWFVEEVTDKRGNRIEYHYSTFPDSPGDIYCTEIRYSINRTDASIYHAIIFDYELRPDSFASCLSGFQIRCGRRCREIRVESQGSLVRKYGFSYDRDPNDSIEAVAPSDAGLVFSLLRKVTQFDNRNGASYLPPLRFGYTRFAATAGSFGAISNSLPYSIGNANLAFIDLNGDSLPDLLYTDPFTSAHQVYYNLGNNRFGPATAFVAAPTGVTLNTPGTELADYDGDGHVDLVQKQGGSFDRFVFFPNTTPPTGVDESRPAWGAEQSFTGPFPPFNLGDPSVRTLDLNGDRRMDFFRTTPYGFIYYYNRGTWWEEDGLHLFGEPTMGDLSAADGVSFTKPSSGGNEVANDQVKLADMNGDRLLDLVRISQAGNLLDVTFWPNLGNGAWGSRQTMSGTVNLGSGTLENLFVQDINGDGLADIVQVNFDNVTFWVNQGNNTFSGSFTVTGTPNYIQGQTVLRQADINGNGSTDFVWENWDPTTGTYKIQYYDFTPVKPNLLRVIDNGIGLRTVIDYKTTTDFYLAAKAAGNPWHTRLPFPTTVVSKITKQIGLNLDSLPGNDEYISELNYFDGYYDGFEKEFRGFAFAKKVERGDDRFPNVTNHSPTTVSRFAFHTGVPDGIDNNGDGVIDEKTEQGGYEEEPLKGKVLWTETTLPTADIGGSYPAQLDGYPANDAVVFTRDINDWQIKLIHTTTNGFTYRDAFGVEHPEFSLNYATTDGKRVSFPFIASTRKEIFEANGSLAGSDAFTPLRTAKQTYSETDVDYFGNPIAERNYGDNTAGSTLDDERFAVSTYAFNINEWLIGLPVRKLVTDENGGFVSETRNYYDGGDFTGLALGQVGSYGELTREESLINGAAAAPAFGTISEQVGDPRLAANASIVTVRNRYNAYGNLVETRDPLYASAGQGHSKEYGYDPIFNTYVTTETIHVGNGSPDLVATAGYDFGAGVMLSATNFNQQVSAFLYDSFWRLIGIVKPGDSVAVPTATFAYTPGDSFRKLYYQYDDIGNLTLVNSADEAVISSVATHQRLFAGKAYTFDTVSFTDGLGQKLGMLEQNDVAGQWVAKDFKLFSSRGAERRSFLPYIVGSSTYQYPAESYSGVASFYDAAGRVTTTVNPPETALPGAAQTQTRTVYLPFETILYDEEQTSPTSSRYLNCHHQFKDGLDRLIGVSEVTRLNDDGTLNAQLSALNLSSWLTSYEYDLNDNLTHITDSQANQKWFRYDGLKRKLFMNDPDRGAMTYTYDDASNLRSTLDAKSQTISYSYDGVNRLLAEFYRPTNQPPDVTYHYDLPAGAIALGDGTTATPQNTLGMLAYVQDLSGEEHTSYDARGRVEFVVKRIPDPLFLASTNAPLSTPLVSYRTGFAYDSLDRVQTLTYADNDSVGYNYNDRNLLNQIVGGPTGHIISDIRYQPSAQLQQIDYGNGVRTTYGYDPRLRLNSLLTVSQPSTTNTQLINFAYEFDGVSNIKSIADNRPVTVVPAGNPRRNTQLFQYDDLYRITRAQYSFAAPGNVTDDGWIAYRYDRIGNMLSQSSTLADSDPLTGLPVANLGEMASGGSAGSSGRLGRQPNDPAGPHALTSISQLSTNNSQLRNYSYDANGNMTVIDGLTNTWDFKDRLVAVENAAMRARYTYDYTDRRISKTVWQKSSLAPTGGEGQGEGAAPSLTTLYIDKYFEVRDHDAPVKYVWNGNTRVARVTGSLNSNNQRVQRVRLWPGYNLISVAVDLLAADVSRLLNSDTNLVTPAATIQAVYRWNPRTLNWQTNAPGTPLAAGSVLWVQAATNGVLTLTGNYSDLTNSPVASGPNFLAVPGLEPLPLSTLNSSLSTNQWHYDAPNQLWQIALGVPLTNFNSLPATLAPGEVLFVRADATTQLATNDPTLRVRYYHEDHLGSSCVLSDINGFEVEELTYCPFGSMRNRSKLRSSPERYQFTRKELDAETGLQYFEERFLANSHSRFCSADPLCMTWAVSKIQDPQVLNLYSYCSNHPLKSTDPTGCEEDKNQSNIGENIMDALSAGRDYTLGVAESLGNEVGAVGNLLAANIALGAAALAYSEGGATKACQSVVQNASGFVAGVTAASSCGTAALALAVPTAGTSLAAAPYVCPAVGAAASYAAAKAVAPSSELICNAIFKSNPANSTAPVAQQSIQNIGLDNQSQSCVDPVSTPSQSSSQIPKAPEP